MECPGLFEVMLKKYLYSPQGTSRMYANFQNMYQIVYLVVEEGIENVER